MITGIYDTDESIAILIDNKPYRRVQVNKAVLWYHKHNERGWRRIQSEIIHQRLETEYQDWKIETFVMPSLVEEDEPYYGEIDSRGFLTEF